MPKNDDLLRTILLLHDRIRDAVIAACERQHMEELASVDFDEAGDTIYAIDRISEDALLEGFKEIAQDTSIYLVAEGLSEGFRILPEGTTEEDCEWRVIVDPIDGTRGLMYQKRSAWILTGVAPNRGPTTTLADIELAIQTEIPLLKQHLSDQIWAYRGRGVQCRRYNRLAGTCSPIHLQPSNASGITHGFVSISRFFPGARDILSAIDDEIAFAAAGLTQPGKSACFEDQYPSSGGQLYELMAGHDRFVADIRPLMRSILQDRNLPMGQCCHPYDVCTALIALEAGVVVTGPTGNRFDAPFSVEGDVAWIGYANKKIQRLVEPILQQTLARHGVI